MKKIIILSVLALLLGGVFFWFSSVLAAEFKPSVTIPGFFTAGQPYPVKGDTLGNYIKAIYTFSVYAGSIVAAVMILVAGYSWLTAGGNVNQIGQAKKMLGGALGGFVLLLTSWVLLNTINPKLVEFNSLNIESIPEVSLLGAPCGAHVGTCVGSNVCNYAYDCSDPNNRHQRIYDVVQPVDVGSVTACCFPPTSNGGYCVVDGDCESQKCYDFSLSIATPTMGKCWDGEHAPSADPTPTAYIGAEKICLR